MTTPPFETKPTAHASEIAVPAQTKTYDRFEDEEKIIAGDLSANMQAFLTRDVQGG